MYMSKEDLLELDKEISILISKLEKNSDELRTLSQRLMRKLDIRKRIKVELG